MDALLFALCINKKFRNPYKYKTDLHIVNTRGRILKDSKNPFIELLI